MTVSPTGRIKQTLPLCLASASPRRRELLSVFGLEVSVCPADVDESVREGEPPEVYVRRLALDKARAVAAQKTGQGILAGDTIVVSQGDMLAKPVDRADCVRMIGLLAGRTHRVITAYCLLDPGDGRCIQNAVETRVTFRRLNEEWIAWYASLTETRDKAGGYAVQGVGAAMVDRIEGSYNNVVGFPVEAIFWELVECGWVELC